MVIRTTYLNKLKKMKDKQIIKVVTGVRRCGKSTLLLQFQEYLRACGVADDQIITINFEDLANESLLDFHALYDFIISKLEPDKMAYVFLDEIQTVPDFQKAANSLFIKDNVDMYITGSNAYMLSGELATLLSGRYIEVKMLPLSFAEYAELTGKDYRSAWVSFFQNGGMPYAALLEDNDVRREYLYGIYNTVLLKDVVARNKIQDVQLLESVIKFLFDNIGNIVSSKKIADTLASSGRKASVATVESYIQALLDACIIYKVGRYDIKGRQYLKSLQKYYIADVGLRRMLLGDRNSDIGHILENIVFLELLRRDYKVSIGKVNDLEVDFIAEKVGEKVYYQVAASVLDESTFAREIHPLKKILDNYPKYIISMDDISANEDGIKQINIINFLLGKE